MDRITTAKRAAARRAVGHVRPGMVVGLGTGSTAAFAVEAIAHALRDGRLRDVVGVPTSLAVAEQATSLGIPLVTLEARPVVDVTIDGADEIDPAGRVVKGAGGALLREKIVAAASHTWILVVDRTKLVRQLGSRYPVPIEVAEFGWSTHGDAIRALGGDPVLRLRDGAPTRTDNGNLILDARFDGGIADADGLAAALRARPGIVETGLFLGFSPVVIVGDDGDEH